MYKTITLGGTEQEVKLAGQNCDIRNDGAETVYISAKPNITAGADGVLSVPVGQAAKLLDSRGTAYLLGTGTVLLCGNDYAELVFKCAATSSGEGGTVDGVARNMASANTANIAQMKPITDSVSNENLLINPDFRINQRSARGAITDKGYFVDGWELVNGTVTINSDGSLTLNGTIQQMLTRSIGDDFSVSISSGEASYDDSARVFTITGNGDNVSWAKLEIGGAVTPFIAPNSATEITKCLWLYSFIGTYLPARAAAVTTNFIDFVVPVPLMRTTPSIAGALEVVDIATNAAAEGFTFTAIKTAPNGVLVRAAKENHGLTDAALVTKTGAAFSAEL